MNTRAVKISTTFDQINAVNDIVKGVFFFLVIIGLSGLSCSDSIAQLRNNSNFPWPSLHSESTLFVYENGGYMSNSAMNDMYPMHSEPGYSLFPDSVYEINNVGLKTDYRRWYYSYNNHYRVDSVYRYFYDEDGDFSDIFEIRTYNPDGQLKRYYRQQPIDEAYHHEPETAEIDYFIEEYSYEGGNLARKLGISNTDQIDTSYQYYIYDKQDRLVYDSTINVHGIYGEFRKSYNISDHLYNSSDQLEYSLRHYFEDGPPSWNMHKFSYEQTDTARITLKQYKRFKEESVTPPVIDTVTTFNNIESYYETFDEEGRLTWLEVRIWTSRYGERKRFQAEYEYTPWGDLLHASYYHRWTGTLEDGDWQEVANIDNTYDEEGNILLYEKTFWDARVGDWVILNRKEYYYSPVSNALGTEENSFTSLKLYPNPAHNIITLKGTYNPSAIYTIADLTGRIIARDMPVKETIDVSSYEPGLYVIIIETDSGLYSGKFVKY